MVTTNKTTVLIVDDHSIMRDGLQEVLERSGRFTVVGQARDGIEAVDEALSLRPDVIIMDLIMPAKDGIEACREIMDAAPESRVLVLTAATDEDVAIQAVAAGATGYLQKFTGKEKLLETMQDVAEGEFRIPADIMRRVSFRVRDTAPKSESEEQGVLTAREREILTLFAQGQSYSQIADIRGNRPLTVRNAIYIIRDKLGAKSKQEMVVWAVRNGLLDSNTTDNP